MTVRAWVVFLLLAATPAVWRAGEAAPPADETPVLRLAIPPWQKTQTIDEIRQQYRPVLEWLGAQIGYRFLVVGGRAYEDTIEQIANGEVQLAVLSPVPYVQAKRRNPAIELLLTELKWNEDRTALIDAYDGYIVALKTRTDLNGPADLRGKRLGFVNLESTSGWRYPRVMLKAAGLDPQADATALFLGSHPRVTDAVAAGSIDAGATWDYNLANAQRHHGDVFKIVVRTPPIPSICLAAHPSVPPDLRRRIRELLPKADASLFASAPMQGYAVRPDAFYDVVRDLIDSEAASTPPSSPVPTPSPR